MSNSHPSVIILAGPNGAGKSTAAPTLLQGKLAVTEFVNADVIAQGLSGFNPDAVSLAAGRIMLRRLHELAKERASFAFETTLASRTFAPWLKRLRQTDYHFHLVYLWLPSVELAVARVADRVRMGGHDVPEVTVRRRYRSGLRNFFRIYQPITTSWRVYDNSSAQHMRLLAAGRGTAESVVKQIDHWNQIKRDWAYES
jgi:predicted ABC-type ATPase